MPLDVNPAAHEATPSEQQTSDHLVVLHSVNGKRAAKKFTLVTNKKGEQRIDARDYHEEKYFRVEEIPVNKFDDMVAVLQCVENDPHAFIIRGAPKSDINRNYTRRLLLRKPDSPATFDPAARQWLLIDCDHLHAPPLCDVVNEPLAAIQYLIGLLPPEFHEVSCWWQFSSSQGLPGSEEFLSVHLWFWSPTPLSDAELKRWANFVNRNGRIVDLALFNAVQAHYVARPLFEGMPDPLPVRSGMWRGLEDAVDVIIPPPDGKNPEIVASGGYEPGLGTQAYIAKIGGGKATA